MSTADFIEDTALQPFSKSAFQASPRKWDRAKNVGDLNRPVAVFADVTDGLGHISISHGLHIR